MIQSAWPSHSWSSTSTRSASAVGSCAWSAVRVGCGARPAGSALALRVVIAQRAGTMSTTRVARAAVSSGSWQAMTTGARRTRRARGSARRRPGAWPCRAAAPARRAARRSTGARSVSARRKSCSWPDDSSCGKRSSSWAMPRRSSSAEAAVVGRGRLAAPRRVDEDEVVDEGQVAIGRRCAEQGGDGGAHGPVALVGLAAADRRGAGARHEQPADDPQQGRLARAVGAPQHDALAGVGVTSVGSSRSSRRSSCRRPRHGPHRSDSRPHPSAPILRRPVELSEATVCRWARNAVTGVSYPRAGRRGAGSALGADGRAEERGRCRSARAPRRCPPRRRPAGGRAGRRRGVRPGWPGCRRRGRGASRRRGVRDARGVAPTTR